MNHPVIPAPARFDDAGGRFALRPGTAVGYTDPALAALVERFFSEVARRTGLRLAPLGGDAGPGEPPVRVELAAGDELGVLPAPLGISPAGGGPPDERYSLAVDADRPARVVINERTGTIVLGKDVRIHPVAILHGNLSVEVQTTFAVSRRRGRR